MKTFKLVPILLLLILSSCSSVTVYSDYDKNVDFTPYKTYAFFKPGIDKVEISDLDKKRILYSFYFSFLRLPIDLYSMSTCMAKVRK